MSRTVYIETYGCQMNQADSEVVQSILHSGEYGVAASPSDADVILVNTCSVRDNAERRVRQRLHSLKKYKRERPGVVIGVLGCMAERLRTELVDRTNVVDLVVGPDEYRKLPQLIDLVYAGGHGVAVRLSRVETYDDIIPLRTEGVSAWVPVMRGCDKFCSFCVVPFTRGRERSRSVPSLVTEVHRLSNLGFHEITLLGQNVNSFRDGDHDFADLLAAVSRIDRALRVRFMTSHPYDMSEKLIGTIARNENICRHIHLPLQSGSDRILARMNRGYSIDAYLHLVDTIRRIIPGVALSTDIITGFPTETDADHQLTLDALRAIGFDGAFMFKYSPRENTRAWDMSDDVPDPVKTRRLNEIINLQQQISLSKNQLLIDQIVDVLVERESTKSRHQWMGRTDTNKTTIFARETASVGDLVKVRIQRCNSATLFGAIASTSLPARSYQAAVNQ